MNGCSDPDCPACVLRRAIQPLKDAGLTAAEASAMVLSVLAEAYPALIVEEVHGDFDVPPGTVRH